jgi:hypothetical protein
MAKVLGSRGVDLIETLEAHEQRVA